MSTAYMIFVVFCWTGLAIRTGYEHLKEAGRIDPKSIPVFVVVFIGMCLMLASWPFMSLADPYPLTLPFALHWMGLLLVILGLGLAVGGLLQLRGLENIDHLVTNGIFSRIRHPMYTGFIFWILGWLIYKGATVSVAMGIIGIVCILSWRRMEELKLSTQFGEAYMRYRKQTWF
jgi:protein-S-isoprenylcysteine O-methyltransferase Ste14